MGNRIYGCDDCLAVCPWNKFARAGREAKLAARAALRAPQLAELARLDDAGFRALFTKSAVKRIGRDRFLRNVLIAIGNSGDPTLAGDAERLLEDASPLVRGAAVWALGRLDRARLAAPRTAVHRSIRRDRKRRGPSPIPAGEESYAVRQWGRQRAWTVSDAMSTLVCFGLGYSAEHFVGTFGDGFERIVGTVRGAERAALLSAHLAGRLKALVFNGTSANPDVASAIGHADCALVSVPPNENGDPVLAAFGDALAHARHLRTIVYLSTVGVYGDHGGEWVDETTPPQPGSARSRARLDAERAWQRLGARAAPPSPSCASPASTDPDRMLWSRSSRETRAGSSSPARSSTASTSPTSRRRSTRPLPARSAASSTSPTTSRARPAIRSPSPRNCSAAIRRRKSRSRKPRRCSRRWR